MCVLVRFPPSFDHIQEIQGCHFKDDNFLYGIINQHLTGLSLINDLRSISILNFKNGTTL